MKDPTKDATKEAKGILRKIYHSCINKVRGKRTSALLLTNFVQLDTPQCVVHQMLDFFTAALSGKLGKGFFFRPSSPSESNDSMWAPEGVQAALTQRAPTAPRRWSIRAATRLSGTRRTRERSSRRCPPMA